MERSRLDVNAGDRISLRVEVLGRLLSTSGSKVLDARLLYELISGIKEEVLHLERVGDQILVARNTMISTLELRDWLWRFKKADTRR